MTSLYIVHETFDSTFPNENSNTDRHETIVKLKTERPSNAFFLYRAAKHEEITNFFKDAGQKVPFESDISKIISQWWKQENDTTRAHYKRQADIVAVEHHKEHPTYKYQPIQKKKKNQGITKQTRITKKRSITKKPTPTSTPNMRITPLVQKSNDECLLPTTLPSQCLSQDDLAHILNGVDFQNLYIDFYNSPNAMAALHQDFEQLSDSISDFCA